MEDSYSHHIKRAWKYLQRRGVKIIIDHKLENDLAGQCDYKHKLIRINEPRAKEALMTLVHEGGHWLSYLQYGKTINGYTCAKRVKEHFAYLFGLELICKLNLPITFKEWRGFHNDAKWNKFYY